MSTKKSKTRLLILFILAAVITNLFIARPMVSAARPASQRAALEQPHLMPPHPTIMEQVRQGKVTLPDYMLNPGKAAEMGIDQPYGLPLGAAGQQPPKGPVGTWKTLALLVKFSDKNSTVTASWFNSLLFGTSFKQLPNYYDAVSYGQLDIVTVNLPGNIGWKTMPQTYAYYVDGNYCIDGAYPHNCRKLAEDAVAAANSVVDFSQYDNDSDGYVDTVFIIHAGRGAEVTGSVNDVWSHSWWTYNEPVVDGVKIGSYTTEPEYWYSVNASTSDMTIGVYAHELGHAFGLPDLYDYDDSSSGVGDWSLMAGGSWNGTNGDSPSFLDAWSRVQLGWVTPINVAGLLTGASIRNAENYQDVYKLKSSVLGSSEYFLVENRQLTGYDAGLPGGGLLIWHVDDAKASLGQPNNTECRQQNNWNCGANHALLALEQSDGAMDLEYGRDGGDGADAYPGSGNKRTFNSGSTPNTSSYYSSADTKLYVINISNSGATMTANLYVAAAPGAFNKSSPANNATGVAINPTPLSWGASSGAVSYEYCIDTSNNNNCDASWADAGAASSVNVNGLSAGVVYYWQVRAKVDTYYTYANSSTWWKFTTAGGAPPGAFNKSAPANNATGIALSPTISWGVSSSASSYEVCYDKVNDTSCTSPAVWTDVGNVTSTILSGLEFNTPYYWQVRAKNSGGTTEAGGGWWKFTTTNSSQKSYLPLILKVQGASPSTLLNGDFEQGQGVGWTEYSAKGYNLIINTGFPSGVAPHGGSWAVWLGGDTSETSYISQQVSVSAGDSYLHLWYWVQADTLCSFDSGSVRINGSAVYTWNMCTNTGGWVELSIDLNAYAGQSVTLEVRAVTSMFSASNLLIDDVGWSASAAPPAAAPQTPPPGEPTDSWQAKPEMIKKGD